MRKFFLILMAALLLSSVGAQGQTYEMLWKKCATAKEKDLPKTVLSLLKQIAEKAERERNYGQLLAAELQKACVQTLIAPDSLSSEVARLEKKISPSASSVQDAVYASVLGHIYLNAYTLENREEKSREYYAMSLRHPEVLAAHRTKEYVPAVIEGVDSKVFGNDLLHVLAIEAGNWQLLRDYYAKAGNRTATDFLSLRDSAEAVIAQVEKMQDDKKIPVKEKIDYIDASLAKWGSYQRMNIVRNVRQELIQPKFYVKVGESVVQPNRERVFRVMELRNIRSLTMTISKIVANGSCQLNPRSEDDYAKLKKLIVPHSQTRQTKYYEDLAPYEIVQDSFLVEPLPVGVYLVEFSTNNKNITAARGLLFVTDLCVLQEKLPQKQIRYAVVSATTGQPVGSATLSLLFRDRYGKKGSTKNFTVDENGEFVYHYGNREPDAFLARTDTDEYLPFSSEWGNFYYYENKTERDVVNLYTDRQLYRPGQTVHVAMLLFHSSKGMDTKAVANKEMTLSLRDANYKNIVEKKVVTDSYGQANADFELPSTGLTGQFSVISENGGGAVYFRVEEYKRPTFEVSFEKVEQQYQVGDTVSVVGTAKTYAGVPVQGATVVCQAKRQQAYWWYTDNEEDAEVLNDTLTTDAEGHFVVNVPLTIEPSLLEVGHMSPRYYSFVVSAIITDQGGESHEATTSLPIGTKPTAFSCELSAKSERTKWKKLKFNYLNSAGVEIPGTVTWQIDGGKKRTSKANDIISVENIQLASGKHTLTAQCGTDTLQQTFVIFSIDDKCPVEETHDWFYQTEKTFPSNGKPVYIQVGSSDQDQHIFYTVIAGEKLLESGVIKQSNALNTRAFTYREEYGSGLCLTYAWVKNGKIYSHSTTIARPLPDKTLKVKWETFRDRLTPGQKEEWCLSVTRPDGTSVNTQLMATLYDKSLDQISRHQWDFSPLLTQNLPSTSWKGSHSSTMSFTRYDYSNSLVVRNLNFSHFDDELFNFDIPLLWGRSRGLNEVEIVGYGKPKRSKKVAIGAFNVLNNDNADGEVFKAKGAVEMPEMASNAGNSKVYDVVEQMPQFPQSQEPQGVQLRENLVETAFFYPALVSDGKGRVRIRFTLPESVTTWRFMGLAHDVDMNYGLIDAEAVAQKKVMVQPNMPRFLREGDKATIAARIFNNSDKQVKGRARLQLVDPETQQVLLDRQREYELKANATGAVSFEVDLSVLNTQRSSLYICKVMAEGKDYSDGEQHYLAVLPNQELVTTTVPFVQHEAGVKTIDLQPLFSAHAEQRKLTIEYTNNPAWMMIQALPSISNPCEKNAVCLAAAYYANSLASHLLHQDERIKNTIMAWKQEEGKETSLMSSLEKNQELKTLVLDETPWVTDARNEADQKQQLISFFDESALRVRLADEIDKLQKLQNPDGSWCWWEGMPGSMYMTTAVSEMMVRLNHITGVTDTKTRIMLNSAFGFMDKKISEEVKDIKKWEKEEAKYVLPSENAIRYLYICALSNRKLSSWTQANAEFLLKRFAKQPTEFTIYGKAVAAIVLAKYGYEKEAKEYLQSLREYTVYTEEMGRYFDTRKAYYSWRDYKIPTEVAAIEAIQLLEPNDRQTVREMQRWLLQSKRTQAWDTPVNTVDAVYAFLNSSENLKYLTNTQSLATFSIDGTHLETSSPTAGLGYIKISPDAPSGKTLTVNKEDDGTSWGAVYAQSLQPLAEIQDAQAGLKVTRELYAEDDHLKIGDRVKIRLTIEAARDYDFVQLQDRRAACLEPVKQLSGYHGGYYISPRDYVTNYYFNCLAKGKHVIETEYYVEREGVYQTGTCTVQCAYSPEYMARTGAIILSVGTK